MTRLSRRLRCAGLLAALVLVGGTGCGGCRPPGEKADSPRGTRLQQLAESGVALVPEVKDELPIRFEAVQFTSREKRETAYINATINWKPADDRPALATWLRTHARQRQPELRQGDVPACVFRFDYLNSAGQVCDSEEITVTTAGTPVPQPLQALARTETPAKVKATLVSATWVKPALAANIVQASPIEARAANGKLALKAPLELPIRFEEMNVNPKDKAASFPPSASWRVVGDTELLRTLLERAAERKPDAAGRTVKNLTLALTYKDRKGQPIGTETVTLDLSGNAGAVSLSQLRRVELGAIGINPVSVTWAEQRVTVPLEN